MKRHLSVGINAYPGQELYGCVNDARDWHALLVERGSQGRVLLDSDATRTSILVALEDLISSTESGDVAVFTYSGHGTWVPDRDGDEADGRDEALVPVDYARAGFILDDTLYAVVQQYRRTGSKILFISDSCHSGGVERAFGQPDAGRRARFLPPVTYIKTERQLRVARAVEAVPANPTSRTGAALFSGCRANEVSWDLDFEGRPNGAMTRAAIDAFRSYEPTSLSAWRTYTHEAIQGEQTPQVEGTYIQRRRTQFI